MRNLQIGIDPGDRWTGIALLQTDDEGHEWYAESYVIDQLTRNNLYFVPRRLRVVLDELSFSSLGGDVDQLTVVIEDYQLRAAGHQKWAAGKTLRVIGAIEYFLSLYPRVRVETVQPADPLAEVPQLPIAKLIYPWRDETWPQPHHGTWIHALSAWRVLGRRMLAQQPRLCERFMKLKPKHLTTPTEYRLYDLVPREGRTATDLVAAPVEFKLPK